MTVSLTDAAINEVKRVIEETPEAAGMLLRISVGGGGCSGFSYRMSFVDESDYSPDKDVSYPNDSINIVVDKKSEPFINGTTVDWHEDLMRRGFVFNNPNAASSCGCGESFSV
jgi:iron-sulfur cluster assembly protein